MSATRGLVVCTLFSILYYSSIYSFGHIRGVSSKVFSSGGTTTELELKSEPSITDSGANEERLTKEKGKKVVTWFLV